MYALIGPEGVYYLVTAMGLSAVLLTSLIPRVAQEARGAKSPMLADIKEGLSHVWRDSLVRMLLAVSLAISLLASPFRSLLPVFVVDVYHRESEAFGLLVSVIGAGSVVGSLAVASLRKGKRGLLVIVGSLMGGVAMLLVVSIPLYFVAAGIMALYGLGLGGREVLNQVLIMEQVENRYRRRVMSIMVVTMGLSPLGVLPIGLVADLVGIRLTVGTLAVALLVAASLVLATQKRIRDLP